MLNSIPEQFLKVFYNGKNFPGSSIQGLENGANCQVFTYEILRHFGFNIPDYRSSELWEDKDYTKEVADYKPLDILLWHNEEKAWGAHVGLYIGEQQALHLSKKNHVPKVEPLDDLFRLSAYKFFIGAKRPFIKN